MYMLRFMFCVISLAGVATQVVAGVFDVGGKPAERMTAYLAGHEPTSGGAEVKGYEVWLTHSLSSGELTKLRACASANKRVVLPDSADEAYVLVCERDQAKAIVDVMRDDAGRFYVRVRDDDGAKDKKDVGGKKGDAAKVVELDRDKMAAVTYSWPKCREVTPSTGNVAKSDAKLVKLDSLRAGWFWVDQENLEERFVHGRETQNPGAVRVLKDARAVVRLPKNYDPSVASGLVVFIHAMPDAVVPGSVGAICDELGFLCVAAGDVGNQTPIADRLQRSLDAVATVQEQYLIDQSRVYATGISGGGKLSVHAWLGYPEVFRGAVPCVGMSAYENLKRADGKYYKGDFPKPNASRIASLKDHRVAAVTGDKDFNYEHIKLSVKLYQRDKFDIRLFDVPGMEHEFAPEATFTDALRWVDEPWREANAKAIARVAELTQQYSKKKDAGVEKDLREAINEAPFTVESWQALKALGESTKP